MRSPKSGRLPRRSAASSATCALGDGVAELDEVAFTTLELADMAARCFSRMLVERDATATYVGVGAFITMGRVVKLEGLAIADCTIDCTGMGRIVTGAISIGIDSDDGPASTTMGAMDEDAGTETMIDMEDEYS